MKAATGGRSKNTTLKIALKCHRKRKKLFKKFNKEVFDVKELLS